MASLDDITEIYEEVSKGDMPPWFYVPMHPEARVSDAELDALRRWAGALR